MARSGTSRIGITVDVTGPVFDEAVTSGEIRRFLDTAKTDLAQAGVNEIHQQLRWLPKHPTGRYASHVVTERAGSYGDQVITDGFVIYGSWLEGTSTRNRTTRFKGYRIFRRTRTKLQKQSRPLLQARLGELLARLR
jgi:hypothetical protein